MRAAALSSRDGDDAFVLDTDAAAGDALVARLRRFLLRTKATVEPVDGSSAPACSAASGCPQAQLVAVVVRCTSPWPRTSSGRRSSRWPAHVTLDAEEHERRRIEAGVPVSGVDIGPDTIPAEAGAWVIESAVSFTKGCYTGQELVARIDSRGGNVPRPLRVLRVRRPRRRRGRGARARRRGRRARSRAPPATWRWGRVGRKVELGAAVVGRRGRRHRRPVSRPPTSRVRRDLLMRTRRGLTRREHQRAETLVGGAAHAGGRRTSRRAPPPGAAVARTCPPMATVSSRTIASPRPEPDSARSGRRRAT